jgi:molecular chaperone GrpE
MGTQAMTDPTARAPEDAGEMPDNKTTEADTAASAQTAASGPDPVKEVAEFRDRWLRSMAEMENLRRRTEREINDARIYGIAGFARDILTVADSMDRALQALDAEIRGKADAGVKALLDGVELTERELLKVLEKHGVKKLDPAGQKFDPNVHQAMYEVPDPSVPAGLVVQVVQSGYTIGERVLRPALVGVSKGGPKTAPGTSAPGSSASDEPSVEGSANGNG